MLVTLELTKHFPPNVRGEIASFTPATAEHILKHNGGKKLAEFDETKQYFDVKAGKVVEISKK